MLLKKIQRRPKYSKCGSRGNKIDVHPIHSSVSQTHVPNGCTAVFEDVSAAVPEPST